MSINLINHFTEFYKKLDIKDGETTGVIHLRVPCVKLTDPHKKMIGSVVSIVKTMMGIDNVYLHNDIGYTKLYFFMSSKQTEEMSKTAEMFSNFVAPILNDNLSMIYPTKDFTDRVSVMPLFANGRSELMNKIFITLLTRVYTWKTEVNRAVEIYEGKFKQLYLIDFKYNIAWTKHDETDFIAAFTSLSNMFPFFIDVSPTKTIIGLLISAYGNDEDTQQFIDSLIEARGRLHNRHIGNRRDTIEVTVSEVIDDATASTMMILEDQDIAAVIKSKINEHIEETSKKGE